MRQGNQENLPLFLPLGRRCLLAVAAGALIPLGYPPFHFWGGSLMAFFPLLVAMTRAEKWKEAACLGLLSGTLAAGITNFWMTSFGHWVGAWAWVFYALATLCQASFFALFGLAFYGMKEKISPTAALLAAPFVFTVLEYLSSFGLFAQEIVGHSQLWNFFLRAGAPLLGVNYLTFLLVSFNACLVLFFVERRGAMQAKLGVALVLALLLVLNPLLKNRAQPSNSPDRDLSIALVQVPLTPEQINDPRFEEAVYAAYVKGTERAIPQHPRLVVWPESVFPVSIHQFGRWRYQLESLFNDFDGEILLGGPQTVGSNFFSAAALFSKGELVDFSQKERLFPYGEAFPKLSPFRGVRSYLPAKLRRDLFMPGFKTDPLRSSAGLLGVTICLESLYGDVVRKRVESGAEILVNLTNDSWFPDSAAAERHYFAGAMRALENGRYFVQSALYGVSGVIDPEGNTLVRTGVGGNQTLTATVRLRSAKTLYARLGSWRFLVFGILTVGYFMAWNIGATIAGKRGCLPGQP